MTSKLCGILPTSIGHTNNLIIENVFLSLIIILIEVSFQMGLSQLCSSRAFFLSSTLLSQASAIEDKAYIIPFSPLMLLTK